MSDIEEIMKMLDCNNNLLIQEEGVRKGKDIKTLKAFFQPQDESYNKNVWENCAKIIYSKSDKEISFYLKEMFEWLQDINWPGAKIIAKRLTEYKDKEWLEFVRRKSLIVSKALKDSMWEEYLKQYDKYID